MNVLTFLFADNTKYLHFQSLYRTTETAIQEDLNIAGDWSLTSNMIFNNVESAVLHFWSSLEDSAIYALNNIPNESRNSFKDLEIVITTYFSWTEQLIVPKAYKSLNLIGRTFKTQSINSYTFP